MPMRPDIESVAEEVFTALADPSRRAISLSALPRWLIACFSSGVSWAIVRDSPRGMNQGS